METLFDKQIKYRLLVAKEKNISSNEGSLNEPRIRTRIKRLNNLNSKYTFGNFIVGSNNEFAKTAAESVSNNPGQQSFNPLIIYGGVELLSIFSKNI